MRTNLKPGGFDEAITVYAKQWLTACLVRNAGNVTRTAEEAGKNRTEFYRVLRRYGLDLAEIRTLPTTEKP